MEVMIPSPARDFNFDSASTTPFLSATSSPQRSTSSSAAFFYSAPTSPTRISTFYSGGGGDGHLSTPSAVPFLWEEKPGTPKSHLSTAASSTYGDADQDLDDADFAFDFTGHLDRHSLPADELFHRGQIKPLKPSPRFHYSAAAADSSLSPKSPSKFSLRHRSKLDVDPFAAAIEETRKETDRRGRERNTTTTTNPHSPVAVRPPPVAAALTHQPPPPSADW